MWRPGSCSTKGDRFWLTILSGRSVRLTKAEIFQLRRRGGNIGRRPKTGATGTFNFHTDTRFMKGKFIGSDEQEHDGTFAFR